MLKLVQAESVSEEAQAVEKVYRGLDSRRSAPQKVDYLPEKSMTYRNFSGVAQPLLLKGIGAVAAIVVNRQIAGSWCLTSLRKLK